jgi:hypothetical protein
MGLVLAPGEAGRDARSEASAAGQAPVALYAGEALPEEMIACRVGVTVQTVEVPDLDEPFFAGLSSHREERPEAKGRESESRVGERKRDRDERPQDERPQEDEPAVLATGGALQPAAEAVVDAEPAPPFEAEPPVAANAEPEVASAQSPGDSTPPPAEGEEPREARRRRGREDRPRATSAAEQAWGQPAGTMKFAPPPGPTVVAQPTSRDEAAPAGEGERTEEPPQPEPEGQKPDGF